MRIWYATANCLRSRDAVQFRIDQAGTIWINTYNLYDAAMPFGGYKQSGYGRDLGRHALDNYTETKAVWVDLRR